KQYTVTTPATVRLRRDNTYRVDIQKSGYKLATTKLVSSYDWLNAPVACGPCELIGDLPTYDLKGRALPLRFLEGAFYEYPRALGARRGALVLRRGARRAGPRRDRRALSRGLGGGRAVHRCDRR